MDSHSQMSTLLKWSLANSTPSTSNPSQPAPSLATSRANAEALQSLFSGPSDATLMSNSMLALQDASIPVSEKLIAFDNLEQLIESIDNANNLSPLKLWTPLLALCQDPEPDLRRMAAWCVGTAVQNNPVAQLAALEEGAVELLLGLVGVGKGEGVRRKAVYALSSLMRNFQPGVDRVVGVLGWEGVDAGDMDAVDGVVARLRGGLAKVNV